jgi:hypothetical protein
MPLTPSPKWAQAMPSGPAAGTRMTAENVKLVGDGLFLGVVDDEYPEPAYQFSSVDLS